MPVSNDKTVTNVTHCPPLGHDRYRDRPHSAKLNRSPQHCRMFPPQGDRPSVLLDNNSGSRAVNCKPDSAVVMQGAAVNFSSHSAQSHQPDSSDHPIQSNGTDPLRSPAFIPLPSSAQPSHPVSTADSDATYAIVENAVMELWQVVNNLTRISPERRDRYRVTIFGSARMQPNDPIYAGVRCLASELTKLGCDIVTGGGPGLMQAANEGSVLADPQDLTKSIGIRVDLSFEQAANPFVEQVYNHQTFFSRLHHFALISDAFVVVPGGIGTALEALMIWQLLQVKKLQDTPLIFVGEMWADLVRWADQFMVNGSTAMVNPADLAIPECVDNFDAAIALLRQAHAQWQHKHHSGEAPDSHDEGEAGLNEGNRVCDI